MPPGTSSVSLLEAQSAPPTVAAGRRGSLPTVAASAIAMSTSWSGGRPRANSGAVPGAGGAA
eukprot:4732281-Lingulodinium_polyedra.AAC.1